MKYNDLINTALSAIRKVAPFGGWGALLLLASCGQTLEDTYKDFAGDGEIRYVGKVTDLKANPGWQHINVSWVNGTDPIIDSVKVRWSSDELTDSVYLPAGTTTYDIQNLTIGSSYEITVTSVDKRKNNSMTSTVYTRPYNEDHEAVQAFTNVVSRYFFLHNHLLMTFVGWDDQVEKAYITYSNKSNGANAEFELTPSVIASGHIDIEDVDASKPVSLYRQGRISGCDDLIIFPAKALENERIFNSEFKEEIKRQFGYDQVIPDSWSNSVAELDLDWTISDFVDLLNLPNLKTLNLGKNRFVREDMVGDAETSQSKVTEVAISEWVLEELNKLNGLTVNRYDKHFSAISSASYINDKGHNTQPSYSLIDLKKASINVLPADDEELIWMGWNSHTDYLCDGDESTSWMPYQQTASTTYTIDIDMKSLHKVHGMRLVQSYYDEANAGYRAICPTKVKIYKSANGSYYPFATNLETTDLGASTGEVNYIKFAEATDIQYIRIEVTTPIYYKNYQVSIAEIGLW